MADGALSMGDEILAEALRLAHGYRARDEDPASCALEVSDEGLSRLLQTLGRHHVRHDNPAHGLRLAGFPVVKHPALAGSQVRIRQL